MRFQVYCLERKFENAEEHPDGLEVDAYDEHAIQGVLFHRPTRGAIGAVRMILTEASATRQFSDREAASGKFIGLSQTTSILRSPSRCPDLRSQRNSVAEGQINWMLR